MIPSSVRHGSFHVVRQIVVQSLLDFLVQQRAVGMERIRRAISSDDVLDQGNNHAIVADRPVLEGEGSEITKRDNRLILDRLVDAVGGPPENQQQ